MPGPARVRQRRAEGVAGIEVAAELDRRFPQGFDPALSISAAAAELRPPAGLLLVASLQTEPVGCGALKFHDDAPTELKRMWVAESARGLGLGRRLLGRRTGG